MARDFDEALETVRQPVTEGERTAQRDDGDTGTTSATQGVFGGGLGGREYDRACEDADLVALSRLTAGQQRRDPSEWGPEERLARFVARADSTLHAIRRAAENASRNAQGAYQASNTTPWTMTPDARRCLVGAITQARIARRAAELAEEKLAEALEQLEDVEVGR